MNANLSNWIAKMLLLFLLASSLAAAAQNPRDAGMLREIRIGLLAHDPSRLVSGFRRERGIDLNVEGIFSPSLQVLGGQFRPAIGGTLNLQGDTSKLYTYGRWEFALSSRYLLASGLGLAWHDGNTRLVSPARKALGSRLLFHIPLEIGLTVGRRSSLSLYFDHISNGYLQSENEGMDTLGIRCGISF